jgi:hypothetical protein
VLQVGQLGPYLCAQPGSLTLPPGATKDVLLRYAPRALGKHDAHVAFQVMAASAAAGGGSGTQQQVVGGCGVEVVAACEVVGARRTGHLPGGPGATAADFTREK